MLSVLSCSLYLKQELKFSTMNKSKRLDNEEMMNMGNEEIKSVTEVEGTPFTVVRVDDKYFLALGKYRISDLVTSEELAKEEINDVSWMRLLSVMHAVARETYFELKSEEDKQKLNK